MGCRNIDVVLGCSMQKFLKKTLHQSYFLVFLCIGIICGVVVGLIFRINFFTSPIWVTVTIILFVIAYLKPKLVFVVVAFVAGMILAFFKISAELRGDSNIRGFYGNEVIVSGEISGDPRNMEGSVQFKLINLEFGEGEKYRTEGNLYITVRSRENIERGDRIVLQGELSEGFGTYNGYMYNPKVVKLLKPNPGNFVLNIRNWFAGRIRERLGKDEANLGLSYLLGMKSGLTEEFSEALRTVGLVHIVVASGAHLSILVEIARKIFGRVSRFAGLLFSMIFIIFFMAMVGWTPSILRAGIMSILTLTIWYIGRKMAPWRMILIVAAMTLMINPMFVTDLGWLLSFASFTGIMVLGPSIKEFLYGEKKPNFIAEIVITTVAATVMTLPIVLYYYGAVSMISVLANLIILPTLPYAMGATFLAGVFKGFYLVDAVISFIAEKILDFHVWIVNFLGQMKYFLVKIDPYQKWVFGIYLVIFIFLVAKSLIKRKKMLLLKHE